MKIAILLGPFQPLPPAGIGAVENAWWDLGRVLAARGHEITILGRAALRFDGGSQMRQGVRVRSFRGFDPGAHLIWNLLKDLIYALRVVPAIPKSDIIVTNSFWAPVVLSALRRRKGRIAVHVARFPKGQMWLYRGADLLQAISSTVGAAIREQAPGLAERVRVLGYPVDLSIFRPDGGPAEARAAQSVSYVGRVHPEKGIRLLLEAFRRVAQRSPDATLEITGPIGERQGGGGAAFQNEMLALASGLRVYFRGPIADRQALAEVYRRAACFCYPSVAESGEALGLAVLEAMACGAPCVVSALACFRDFVREGDNALVFDHRAANAPERLAEAISSVLTDAALAGRLSRSARARALEFGTERVAGQYLRLFEETCAR